MGADRQERVGWEGAVDRAGSPQTEAQGEGGGGGGGELLVQGEVRRGLASQPQMPCALTESPTSCVRTTSWTPTVCHTLRCMAMPQENKTHRNPCPHKKLPGSSKEGN